MKTALALAAVLLIPVPAQAEMLLLEIHHAPNGGLNSCGEPFSTAGCAGVALIANRNGQTATFSKHLSAPDVGIEYGIGDPALLAQFNELLQDPATISEIWTTVRVPDDIVVFHTPNQLWEGPNRVPFGDVYTTTRHAAQRGFGFSGYELTDITTTLDHYQFMDRFTVIASQTLRFYGFAIPEPASWLLASLALCLLLHRRPYRVSLS
jgi:hypothetical protein